LNSKGRSHYPNDREVPVIDRNLEFFLDLGKVNQKKENGEPEKEKTENKRK